MRYFQLVWAFVLILVVSVARSVNAAPAAPGYVVSVVGVGNVCSHEPVFGGQNGCFAATVDYAIGGYGLTAFGTTNDQKLYSLDIATGTPTLLDGAFTTGEITVDASRLVLWAKHSSTLRKYALPWTGSFTTVATTTEFPQLGTLTYMTTASSDGSIWGIGYVFGDATPSVVRLSGTGISDGGMTLTWQKIAGPPAMVVSSLGPVAVDAANNAYVVDFDNGVIKRIPSGGSASNLTNPVSFTPFTVAYDAENNFLYSTALDPSTVETLYEINMLTGTGLLLKSGALQVGLMSSTVLTTTCGNGVVEGSEQCDPGPDLPNDCCKANCTVEAVDTPCDDDDECTLTTKCNGINESCGDGLPLDCNDLMRCTTDTCDPEDGCLHTLLGGGAPCEDGNLCTINDTCDGSADGCNAGGPKNCSDGDSCTADLCTAPTGVCTHPGQTLTSGMDITVDSASIQVKDFPSGDLKDQLQVIIKTSMLLQFGEAAGEMGDPVEGSTNYQFCGFDDRASALYRFFSVNMPPGGTCKGKPCCKILGKPLPGQQKGFACQDPNHEHSPISKFQILRSNSGTTIKLMVQKQDFANLIASSSDQLMEQGTEVKFQFCSSNGTCALVNFPAGWLQNAFQLEKGKGLFKDKL